MVGGIGQVVLEVEDQDRALAFWTGPIGFELVYDGPTAAGSRGRRWSTRHRGLESAAGRAAGRAEILPTSNLCFPCDDLSRTYAERRERGIEFPQPPVRQPFGWWSMFEDSESKSVRADAA